MSTVRTEAEPGTKHFWDRTFLALKLYRNYRLVWLGSLTEHFGEWMEMAATLWLVHQLGGTAFDLAMVAFFRHFPLVFLSTLGGVVADRINRRNLVVYTLLFSAALSVTLLFLVRMGTVQIWHIFAISTGSAVATAFNHPGRQTLVPNLVEKKHLLNALTLDTVTTTASRAIGVPVAGLLIFQFGVVPVFGVRAVGSLLAVVWLMMVKVPLIPKVEKRQNAWKNIVEGWSYMRANPLIMSQVGMYFFAYLEGQLTGGFMPIFALDVLGASARGYGWLQAAPGIGAIIGLFILASLKDFNRKGLYLFIAAMAMTLAIGFFAVSSIFILSLFLLIFAGAMNHTYMSVNATIIQSVVDDKVRGRVMAWREIAFGVAPISGLIVGKVAEYMAPDKAVGVPRAILLMSMIFMAILIALFFLLPRVRKFR